MAVNVAGAPICAGAGGGRGRKPCDAHGRRARPEPCASVSHGVPCAPSSTGLSWAIQGVVPVRSHALRGAREDRPRKAPRSRPDTR